METSQLSKEAVHTQIQHSVKSLLDGAFVSDINKIMTDKDKNKVCFSVYVSLWQLNGVLRMYAIIIQRFI